jgi:hypothetical protein
MSASIGAFGIIIVISVALLPAIRNMEHFPFPGGSRCFLQEQKLFMAWAENVGMFVIILVAYFITLKCSFTQTGAVAVGFILDCQSFYVLEGTGSGIVLQGMTSLEILLGMLSTDCVFTRHGPA